MSAGDYKPDIGGNTPRSIYAADTVKVDTFADLDRLRELLEVLFYQLELSKRDLEVDLENYALLIDLDSDQRLLAAHQLEWPTSDLGSPPNFITYPYYKVLKLRSTTTAGYICKRYEEGVRDVTGTPSLDLLILVETMYNESSLIQEFADVSIRRVDDSSEFRILESFQAWVQSSLAYAGQIREILRTKDEKELSQREINNTTPQQAKQSQAVSKIQLNSHNNRLVKTIEQLNINFSEFAPVFYHKHLKPALDYRLSVSRKVYPSSSPMTQEVLSASRVLDDTVRSAITDQHRRKELFDTKVLSVLSDVRSRELKRKKIVELSNIGKAIAVAGPRIMVPPDSAKELSSYFYAQSDLIESNPPQNQDPLGSGHAKLTGLFSDDHPQYLLRSGGHLNGDITLTQGILVDGVDIDQHAHTGDDGSIKIGKESISDYSLVDRMIDTEDKPSEPTDLQLIDFYTDSNSTDVSANVKYTQIDGVFYEIQIAKIEQDI